MKEKKKSSNWYIAATHYLTAGFVIPLIIGLIASFILLPLIKFGSPLLIMVFLLAIRILSIWLGTIYSANYLKKTYIIGDKAKIINLATMYLVVLNGGYILLQIFMGKAAGVAIIYSFVDFSIAAFLFYIISKKYIQNTETTESQI
ncbi:MAG: hypothetical protein ABIG29_02955 [Candidatus Nealsonbacteria bacterium]